MSRLGRCAFVAVILLLLISVLFNIFLLNRARQYYLDLNAVRLNPLDLDAYQITSSAPSTKPRVVFFGDSRAVRWPVAAVFDRFEVVNRGVEAETSAQAVLRFPAHVLPLHPDVLVIQVGVNDLKTIPLFPERKAEIIATTKENIRYIIKQSTDLGARVVLTTIFPIGDFPLERRVFWSPEIGLALQEVNDYLRSLSGARVNIFDTAAFLTLDGRANPKYYDDELHLSESGYAMLNDELRNILNQND